VYVWLPERKNNFVALRQDVKLIELGKQPSMTIAESKALLPEMMSDGTINLKSKTNVTTKVNDILAQFRLQKQGLDSDTNELNITTRSTLEIEDDHVDTNQKNQSQHVRRSERIRAIQESFQELEANGIQIFFEDPTIRIEHIQESLNELEANGIRMILEDKSIDVDEIMAYGSAIVDQYSWNHPKWEDAIVREDRDKWLEADR
jgi:hypothetical protein